MTCLSAGKKTDLLTAVVCLSEYYCWMLDVGVCRARLFIRRFGLLPQKATFLKTQLVIVICLPGPLLLFFCSPTSEDRALDCVISHNIVPLCIVLHHYVYSVTRMWMNHVLESLHEMCDHYRWIIEVTAQLGCTDRLTLAYTMQYVKAAFLLIEAMPLIKINKMLDDRHAHTFKHSLTTKSI